MALAFKCDRCNTFQECEKADDKPITINYWSKPLYEGDVSRSYPLQLCDACGNSFFQWKSNL